MKFTVLWTCDDEFCMTPHGSTEIEEPTEEAAIDWVIKERKRRDDGNCSLKPWALKLERELWRNPVEKF